MNINESGSRGQAVNSEEVMVLLLVSFGLLTLGSKTEERKKDETVRRTEAER